MDCDIFPLAPQPEGHRSQFGIVRLPGKPLTLNMNRTKTENQAEIARCLFRESNDAIFLFDPRDHRVVDSNPVSVRLTGFDSEEARRMRIWQIFQGVGSVSIHQLIEAYQRTGFFHSQEGFLMTRKAGDALPVNLSVSRIHTRPDPMGLVVARDISERLRVQEELLEKERRFRCVVESARVLIWTLSVSGSVTSVNPEFEFLTGWMRDDWLNRPMAELVHPDDRVALQVHLVQAVESGTAPFLHVRVATKYEGFRRLELLSTSRVIQKKTIGVSVIARDLDALQETS